MLKSARLGQSGISDALAEEPSVALRDVTLLPEVIGIIRQGQA